MGMATDDSNFILVRKGVREQRLKNRKKSMIFAIFLLSCPTVQPVARPPVGQFSWNFRSWMGECMTTDDSNFIGMRRGVQEQRWKRAEKLWFSLFFAFDCQMPQPIARTPDLADILGGEWAYKYMTMAD